MSKITTVTDHLTAEADTRFGVRFYVCGNVEVIRDRTELSEGELAAADSAARAILAAGYDYERVSDFRAYNGGPRGGLIDAQWYAAVLFDLEEGETEREADAWRAVPERDVPDEVRAMLEPVLAAAWGAFEAKTA